MKFLVEIKNIEELPCRLTYDDVKEGVTFREYVGTIYNQLQLNDVRLQIQRFGVEGYGIEFLGQWVAINKYGMIPDWPKDLFSLMTYQCIELIRNGIKMRKEGK